MARELSNIGHGLLVNGYRYMRNLEVLYIVEYKGEDRSYIYIYIRTKTSGFSVISGYVLKNDIDRCFACRCGTPFLG